MNILIIGAPLSGKGTQSKKIIEEFGITHLSTGDILREEKSKGTDLGIQVAEFSEKGLLAPDELVSLVVEKFYNENKLGKGLLYDGYPRSVSQANHLLSLLKEDGNSIDLVIYLKVPEEELMKRAIIRAEAEGRVDDSNSDIVLNRIKQFRVSTFSTIEYLKSEGILTFEINGSLTPDEIYKVISNNLKSI
jgi:adenylate kinase